MNYSDNRDLIALLSSDIKPIKPAWRIGEMFFSSRQKAEDYMTYLKHRAEVSEKILEMLRPELAESGWLSDENFYTVLLPLLSGFIISHPRPFAELVCEVLANNLKESQE